MTISNLKLKDVEYLDQLVQDTDTGQFNQLVPLHNEIVRLSDFGYDVSHYKKHLDYVTDIYNAGSPTNTKN